MSDTKTKYRRGYHPNSLKNLSPGACSTMYDERKKARNVSITDTAWEAFKQKAKTYGISASELIERIGRDIISISEDS